MGLLVDGKWVDRWYNTDSNDGRFVRSAAQFRNWVTADGAPGSSGAGGFKAAPDRYHLYIAYACPWAHRTMIYRSIKGLKDIISVSITHWFMGEFGWSFEEGPGVVADPINDARYLHQIYTHADPNYSGRVTVPILWDKEQNTIVSNESSEIIRMFNSAFDGVGAQPGNFLPTALEAEIDAVNERVYHTLNNGVYRCGFATSQSAYEEAVLPLFETLDFLEQRLNESRYIAGDEITEADWRLLPTLLRFDAVYYGHFKCNLRRLSDYEKLSNYTRELYQYPGVAETFNFQHAKDHYYQSHESINPTRIVPRGPQIDFDLPHNRH
ncbi:MAG: glutathione S-transferase family protein [Pseudomonadota bacterium]